MKNVEEILKNMNIEYTIDKEPSSEKVDKILKSLGERDKRVKAIQDAYKIGGIEEVKKYLENE